MRSLRITLFVIALVTLGSQAFRHAYVRWLQPRGSVLDKYQTRVGQQTEDQIASAKSLDELVTLFDAAHKKVLEYEKTNPPKAGEENLGRYRRDIEPYASENKLRDAIEDWESESKDTRELWIFWLAGLAALAIGSVAAFKSDRWIGMAFVILGFAEMVWATSPISEWAGGRSHQFDRLLVHKFSLCLLSLALLLVAWFIAKRRDLRQS